MNTDKFDSGIARRAMTHDRWGETPSSPVLPTTESGLDGISPHLVHGEGTHPNRGGNRTDACYLRAAPLMASTARNATGSPATARAATSFSTASLAFTTAVYWSRVRLGADWTDLKATNASR